MRTFGVPQDEKDIFYAVPSPSSTVGALGPLPGPPYCSLGRSGFGTCTWLNSPRSRVCGSLQLPEAPSWEEEAVRSRGTSWGVQAQRDEQGISMGCSLGLEGSPPPMSHPLYLPSKGRLHVTWKGNSQVERKSWKCWGLREAQIQVLAAGLTMCT